MGRAIYILELEPDEVAAIEFARGRYEWATELAQHLDDEKGACIMTESEAWWWQEACDLDAPGQFPLAAPAFAEKLQLFKDSIV